MRLDLGEIQLVKFYQVYAQLSKTVLEIFK